MIQLDFSVVSVVDLDCSDDISLWATRMQGSTWMYKMKVPLTDWTWVIPFGSKGSVVDSSVVGFSRRLAQFIFEERAVEFLAWGDQIFVRHR